MKKTLLERAKPKTFNQLVLSDRIKNQLNGGLISNPLLFHGGPGLGKTSTALVCAKITSGYNLNTTSLKNEPCILKINLSDEGVDVMRNKVKNFLTTKNLLNFENKPKTILIEEFDGANHKMYKMFRGFYDDFGSYGKWVATCNNINIIKNVEEGAIFSRFKTINFTCETETELNEIFEKQVKRCKVFLNHPDINIKASHEIVEDLVRIFSPDWRKIIMEMETWSEQNIKEITKEILNDSMKSSNINIYNLLISKPDSIKLYKEINMDYTDNVQKILEELGTDFIDWLIKNHPKLALKVGQIMVIVNEHQYKQTFAIDGLLNLRTCLYKIQKTLNIN